MTVLDPEKFDGRLGILTLEGDFPKGLGIKILYGVVHASRGVIEEISWGEDIKLGGEHHIRIVKFEEVPMVK